MTTPKNPNETTTGLNAPEPSDARETIVTTENIDEGQKEAEQSTPESPTGPPSGSPVSEPAVRTSTVPIQGKESPTPPSAIAPGATPTPQQDLQAALRRVVALETQQAAQQARDQQQQDEALLDGYGKDLAERGYQPEDVKVLVGERRALVQGARQQQVAYQQMQQALTTLRENDRAKVITILWMAKEYGMPIEELMRFDDPNAMLTEAKLYQANKDLEKLKQAQVKPLKLASTAGGGSPGGLAAYQQRLKNGQELPPAEDIDRMTAKYLSAR